MRIINYNEQTLHRVVRRVEYDVRRISVGGITVYPQLTHDSGHSRDLQVPVP